jgi:hypothetical protein
MRVNNFELRIDPVLAVGLVDNVRTRQIVFRVATLLAQPHASLPQRGCFQRGKGGLCPRSSLMSPEPGRFCWGDSSRIRRTYDCS